MGDEGPADLMAQPEPGPAVRVRGLVKSYGSVPAVRGVDLEIERGQIFALLGPNGAGQSRWRGSR